ncbi:MAG TPA: PAS domain S-box protein, partial [Candidatus Krumholzibacterium sp.]|nr:PAS domain S-box protein [Candidatus Krumholzibacterium sp.]
MMSTRPEDYLESVFESSPVPLISIDMRFRVIMFNRSAGELTGYESGDITGKRITRLLSLERVRRMTSMLRSRRNFPSEGMMTELRIAGGGEIPVKLKLSPLYDSENTLIGMLIVASDLREIKEMNSKMLEAERLAAITETAISVNHEINNPLCSILGNTQLILQEKENLDPRTVRKLENIE